MLPLELKLKMMEYLDQIDLLCLAMTNHEWRQIIIQNADYFSYLLLKGRKMCFMNKNIFNLLTAQQNHLHTLSRLEKVANIPPIYKMSQSLESLPVLHSTTSLNQITSQVTPNFNVQHLNCHTDRIIGVSISRIKCQDIIKTFIVAISDDRSFSLWLNTTDTNEFKMIQRKRLTSAPSTVQIFLSFQDEAFQTNGKDPVVYVGFGFYNGNVRLLQFSRDFNNKSYLIGDINHPTTIRSIAVNSNYICVGCEDGQLISINYKVKRMDIHPTHRNSVTKVQIVGNCVLSSSDGKLVQSNFNLTLHTILQRLSKIYTFDVKNDLIYCATEQGIFIFQTLQNASSLVLKMKTNDILTCPGAIMFLSCDGDYTFLASAHEIIILRNEVIYSRFRYSESVKNDPKYQKDRLMKYTDLYNDSNSGRSNRITSFMANLNGFVVGGIDSILRIIHYNSRV